MALRIVSELPLSAPLSGHAYSPVELGADDRTVYLLEQRKLPHVEEYVAVQDVKDLADAVTQIIVRGAPTLGVTAAYGMVLAAAHGPQGAEAFDEAMATAAKVIAAARPTAVNLSWGAECMRRAALEVRDRAPDERVALLAERARALHRDEVSAMRRMGDLGAELLPDDCVVLTHCNAGALACVGYGSALGVIRSGVRMGKVRRVLADETRPYLQGARLTAWELAKDGIPVDVITDGMPGHFFQRGAIHAVVVGADRIAKNGDVANKIGTYGVAVLAHHHGVPFYVAAPMSTFDPACPSGEHIPIEERSSREVTEAFGVSIAPEGVGARHPGFDVTPARFVTAIVTERGVARPPSEGTVAALYGDTAPSPLRASGAPAGSRKAQGQTSP